MADAILSLLPIDLYDEQNLFVMEKVPGDKNVADGDPAVYAEFNAVADKNEGKPMTLTKLERFAFYERAKKSFAVVHTGETKLYANLIIKKGVVPPKPQWI